MEKDLEGQGIVPHSAYKSEESSDEYKTTCDENDEEAVYEATTACLYLLSTLTSKVDLSDSSQWPEQKASQQHDGFIDSIRNLRLSFNNWIDNTGALAPVVNSALDARLQGYRDIKDMTLELLQMLSRNLRYLGSLHDQDLDGNTNPELLQEAIISSQYAVKELHFLARAIRKSSARTTFSTGLGRNGDQQFENYVFLHIKQTLPQARRSLCKQLSASMRARREHLSQNRERPVPTNSVDIRNNMSIEPACPGLDASSSDLENEMQPYTCLSEECTSPLLFFGSMRDWVEHMTSEHSDQWTRRIHMSTWFCDTGHESIQFNDLESFIEHMKKPDAHPSRSVPSNSQLDTLCRTRQRILTREDIYACPLCESVPDSLNPTDSTSQPKDTVYDLHKHIADHLKDFASLSIPNQPLLEMTKGVSNIAAASKKQRRLESSDIDSIVSSDFEEIRATPSFQHETPEETPPLDVEETTISHWREVGFLEWHGKDEGDSKSSTSETDVILRDLIQDQAQSTNDLSKSHTPNFSVPWSSIGRGTETTARQHTEPTRIGKPKVNDILCIPCGQLRLMWETGATPVHQIPIPPFTSTCSMCRIFDWLQELYAHPIRAYYGGSMSRKTEASLLSKGFSTLFTFTLRLEVLFQRHKTATR
ncbi:hypothetical protein PG990_011691 [Apiospora arundinis]